MPEYALFIGQMYSPSKLVFGDNLISSESGVQQGDPLGPLLFCLVTWKLISSLKSTLNVWYLDDGTIGGEVDTVIDDLRIIIRESRELGLELNVSKCELFVPETAADQQSIISRFSDVSPNLTIVPPDQLCLLGSPVLQDGLSHALADKHLEVSRLISRLPLISAHRALYVLSHCWGIPKFTYLLRSAPFWKVPLELRKVDETIRRALTRLCNTEITGQSALQSSLPIRYGGLGIRTLEAIAMPAFASSVHRNLDLMTDILPAVNWSQFAAAICDVWTCCDLPAPPTEQRKSQRAWDTIVSEKMLGDLRSALQHNIYECARLDASLTPEASSWLHAYPVPALGTHLSDDHLRIAVALRIGITICKEHSCRCGKPVDSRGYHGLSCYGQSGRIPRHSAINEIVRKALATAGFQPKLEPRGLDRVRNSRPDGLTQVAFEDGKLLAWDVTVVDTMADAYIDMTTVGAAADLAERKKIAKYQGLSSEYSFRPLGFETMGTWGPEAKELVNRIGSRLIQLTGEKRSLCFLRQNISLAIQRGNANSILGTFSGDRGLDTVFYVLRC